MARPTPHAPDHATTPRHFRRAAGTDGLLAQRGGVHRVGGDTVAHDVTFPYRVTDADDHHAIADPVADPEPDGWGLHVAVELPVEFQRRTDEPEVELDAQPDRGEGPSIVRFNGTDYVLMSTVDSNGNYNMGRMVP